MGASPLSRLSQALKNTMVLTLAEVLNKGMNFIFIAILARQLSPSDFGGYHTLMSLVWLIGPLADLGVSQVLIREVAADRSKAPTLLANALVITGSLSALAAGVLVAAAYIARFPDPLRPLIALAALAVVGNCLTQTAGAVLRGLERMDIQALLTSGLLLLASLVGIFLALMGFGLAEQVWSQIIFALASAGLMLTVLHRRFVRLQFTIVWRQIQSLFSMALPVAAMIAYSVLLRWADTIVLGQVQSMDAVAVYSTAQKVIDLAMIVVTSASIALFPVLSSQWRESQSATRQTVIHASRFFVAFGVAVSVGLYILAEPIAVTLFGAHYALTAVPLRWLAWAFLFQVFTAPMGTLVLTSGDRLKRVAPAMGGIVLGNILLNLLLAPTWGYLGAAVAFFLTSIGNFIVSQAAAYLFFDRPPSLFPLLLKPTLAGLGMGIVLQILSPFGIWVAIPAGGLVYLLGLILLGELKEEPYRGLIAMTLPGCSLPPRCSLPPVTTSKVKSDQAKSE